MGVGVVLGLAQQVSGDQLRIGVAVGDDQQFGRAGGHVDGGAAGQIRRLFLGLGDPGVARSEQLVTGGDDPVFQLGAEGQGGDGVHDDMAPPAVQQHGGDQPRPAAIGKVDRREGQRAPSVRRLSLNDEQ